MLKNKVTGAIVKGSTHNWNEDLQGWSTDGCGHIPDATGTEWEELPTPPNLSPVQFKMLFTSLERIAIKAARASDPVIDDAYDLLDDPRLTEVDLTLASTHGLIDYLVGLNLLTAERAKQVQAGEIL